MSTVLELNRGGIMVNLTKSSVDLFKYNLSNKTVQFSFTHTLKAGKLFSVQSK